MSEKVVPFVVTDRRKFTLDGDPNPEFQQRPQEEPSAPPPPAEFESSARVVSTPPPAASAPEPPAGLDADHPYPDDSELPPPPTPEQMEQSKLAFNATADRLDTAIRATNPGMDHPPAMNFDRMVQSIYMTAIMQLGGATPEGQKPQVDLLGARQSIDMLNVIAERTAGNLTTNEIRLIDSALFELRLGFLEITQALARSASARNPQPGGPGGLGGPGSGPAGGPPPGFGIVR